MAQRLRERFGNAVEIRYARYSGRRDSMVEVVMAVTLKPLSDGELRSFVAESYANDYQIERDGEVFFLSHEARRRLVINTTNISARGMTSADHLFVKARDIGKLEEDQGLLLIDIKAAP